MMEAPERIWVAEDECGNPWWSTSRDDEMDEYIRADLVPRWQPIETAPKDRRMIVVIGVWPRYTTDPWCVWWDSHDNVWMRWDHVRSPTHWMPLPDEPKGDE